MTNTIRDIARAAQVSVGTVSNYLNNPELVAEDTRAAIQAAIERLDYHPHAAARSLKSRLTHRIGLVPVISVEDNRSMEPGDNAFLDFLSAVNTCAAEQGYDILLAAATSPDNELKIYERLVGEKQVDGLIVMGMRPHDSRIEWLLRRKFPFVSYGRTDIAEDHSFVDVDGAAGIESAVEHLAGLGHTRIAYVTPPAGLACTTQRWSGFERAMQARNLPIRDEYILSGGFFEKNGQIAMHLLLDLPEPPTAILTANDLCAFGAIRAAQSRGVVPGRDISIIGFDDIALASHWQPALTTIAQPFRKIGFAAVELLISSIQENSPKSQMIAPHLVVRQSTGPVQPG